MRITKFVVITASIVAILAAIAWFLRDYLIERVSNPLLAEYGITVTDVSLDALATDDASISYLELVHEKGTTIAIENLTLPISARSDPKIYTASKVSVSTGRCGPWASVAPTGTNATAPSATRSRISG